MILRNQGRFSRDLITLAGKITYTRTVLYPTDDESALKLMTLTGEKSIAPIDYALELDRLPFKITIKAMVAFAKEAVYSSSYKDAGERIAERYKIKLSDSRIKSIVDFVGGIVYKNNEKRCSEAIHKRKTVRTDTRKIRRRADDILYLEVDGAMVNTRQRSDGSTWHECKLAMAFKQADLHFWKSKKGELRHGIDKRTFSGVIGDIDAFKPHLLALADQNDFQHTANIVVISDGAKWISNVVNEYFPRATHILDLFHVKEHVGEFAKVLFNNNAEKVKEWSDKLIEKIEASRIDEVLKELEIYKDRKFPAGVTNLYNYIQNHKSCMDYKIYKEKGYFVGSGAIESANKYVIQNRLKLQGMRWDTISANYMLALKMCKESCTWDRVEKEVREFLYS